MTRRKKQRTVTGIAWYRPEQWNALKEFCEDWETMDTSYDDWKRHAEKTLRNLRAKGLHVQPVDFDLQEFKMWCSTNGKRPNAEARSEFAAMKVRDLSKD